MLKTQLSRKYTDQHVRGIKLAWNTVSRANYSSHN